MKKGKKSEVNVWKIVAIVFIVLFVLETLLFFMLMAWGAKMEEREMECAVNICPEVNGSVSYYYEDYNQMCYCYSAEDEVVKEQFIK